MSHLNKIELFLYFFTWTGGVLYSIYKVYEVGNLFAQHIQYDDFSPGWPIIGRMKDISDFEWNSMIPLLTSLMPWFFCHVLVNEVIRLYNRKLLPYSYFITGSICVLNYYGPAILVVFALQPVIFYCALWFKSTAIIWLCSLLLMFILNMNPMVHLKEVLELQGDDEYLISVTLCWIHLRCISFCLECLMVDDRRDKEKISKRNFISFLSYVFYLPLMFLGPVMLYKDFEDGPDIVLGMDSWTLFGLGYCMGQFFMNKYTVLYGLSTTFARFEQFNAPTHPKCIGRIHLYSDMWKHFDVGLYSFLVRYIYVPTCGKSRNLAKKYFASFLCFGFVYVWHGTTGYIFVWAMLNFIGIAIEGLAKAIYYSTSYSQWEARIFTPNGARRFQAMIASPLLMMSALSNFYFFAGMEVGNIFVQKIVEGWCSITLVVLVFVYCCCHVSIEAKEQEKRKRALNQNEKAEEEVKVTSASEKFEHTHFA
ncbi:hypothetical protein J437_LFUL003907 [Ladona fulva]|uniref:Protein-cysteine N-palmitoyltransferase Rasp n=1 Tax=Ladona fulva TaxID=123851 RepID=A0A8K0K4X4_LADFU|nr:hypothetical protein J437_LFUL003907 [Ladona fulva]